MSNYDDVVLLLDSLTQKELKQVSALITLTLQNSDEGLSKDHVHGTIYQGLVAAADTRGLTLRSYSSVSQKDKGKFKKSCRDIEEWIRDSFRTKEHEDFQVACIECGKCLIDWLMSCNAPISTGTLLKNIHNIPTSVEEAYPRYAQYGLLPNVIRVIGDKGLV